jgi:hypothetical protein
LLLRFGSPNVRVCPSPPGVHKYRANRTQVRPKHNQSVLCVQVGRLLSPPLSKEGVSSLPVVLDLEYIAIISVFFADRLPP